MRVSAERAAILWPDVNEEMLNLESAQQQYEDGQWRLHRA